MLLKPISLIVQKKMKDERSGALRLQQLSTVGEFRMCEDPHK